MVLSDVVAVWIEHLTSDQEVIGSTPAQALLHNNLRQVVHTLVPLSPSSKSWYRCKNREGNSMFTEEVWSTVHNTEC